MQIVVNKDFQKAIEKAKEILYEKIDARTVLFLSGGATPKSLYVSLAKDAIIRPAAVGMIDERFGKKLHEKSNETMIADSGFLTYVEKQHIPFYPILTGNGPMEKMAEQYDSTTRDLFFHFKKSVAVMGIGEDGHIAGILPGMENNNKAFIVSYINKHMRPPERITMTFEGLSLIDFFIVLAFGKEKKKPLQNMFTQGTMEEIPSRFFMQVASNNTIIVTDQNI